MTESPGGRAGISATILDRALPPVVALLMCCGVATSAWSVPPCHYYRDARLKAAAHLQLKLIHVKESPRSCPVRGEIVRIFRDVGKRYKRGDVIEVEITCANPGDGIAGHSGDYYTLIPELERAHWLEVFLTKDGRIPMDQVGIIEAPTPQPVCSPEAECFCFGSLVGIP